MTAKIVCFEGIDGSGKSTLLSAVARALELNGVGAVTLCAVSAGETFFSELRTFIHEVPRASYCDVVAFNRYLRIKELLAAHTDEADVLLFDRYLYSDLAYARSYHCDTTFIEALIGSSAEPHLLVYCDVPVAVAMRRIHSRDRVLEFQENSVVLQGALRGYADIRSSRLNVIAADGCGDLAVVSAQVLAAVTALVRGDERVSARESRG